MTKAADVASWMLSRVEAVGVLHQDDAVGEIEQRFGSDFVRDNDAGNPAIAKTVLAAFRKISDPAVVWCKGERLWRPREPGDEPGREQP